MNGRVLFLALVCFCAGWLWSRLLAPVPRAPASQPVCPSPILAARAPASMAVREAKKSKPASLPTSSPVSLPRGALSALRACVSSQAYAGSRFVLQLQVADDGHVARAKPVGAEFMSENERRCISQQAGQWELGVDAPPEVLVTVDL